MASENSTGREWLPSATFSVSAERLEASLRARTGTRGSYILKNVADRAHNRRCLSLRIGPNSQLLAIERTRWCGTECTVVDRIKMLADYPVDVKCWPDVIGVLTGHARREFDWLTGPADVR